MKIFILIAVTISLYFPVNINSEEYYPAVLSLNIPPSGRASGLGNAYTSVGEGIAGLYYNPAGILVNKNPEIGVLNTNCVSTLEDNEKLYEISALGFLYPFKNGKYGAGILIKTFKVPQFNGYDEYGNMLSDKISQEDTDTSFAGSMKIAQGLYAGATLKFVNSSLLISSDEQLKGSAGTLDIGCLYEKLLDERFSAGLVLYNLGGTIKYKYEKEPLPGGIRIGGSYRFLEDKNLLIALDLMSVSKIQNSNTFNLGAEWSYRDWLMLRFGISRKPAGGFSSTNFGLGIRFRNFGFDYSPASSGGVSVIQRTELSYKFGKIEKKTQKPSQPKPEKARKPEKPLTPATPAVKPLVERKNLAIADFTGKNASSADASIVADFLRTELVNLNAYNVMERANMETVLAEQKFQLSGCTDQECAVKMGKLLNVQQMIVGSLSKLLDTYYITVNLMDVETGKILKSFDEQATNASELRNACRILAQKLSQ